MDGSPAFHDVPVGRDRCGRRVSGRDVLRPADRCLGLRKPGGADGGARGKRDQTQATAGYEGKRG